MEFQQLSISDQRYPDFVPVTYASLNNEGKIYTKIDWLTFVFSDCSMDDVLKWIHLDHAVSDFLAGCYEQSKGYDEVFRFVYNGVLLETSKMSFYGNDGIPVFSAVCPKIRLDLSGSALDYLRSIGVDMDTYRLVKPELPVGGCYHVTRCDWAYDLVNYRPEFLDRLIDHIFKHRTPADRVPLAGTRSAVSFKIMTGGQKTVYLGRPQSDKLLRVYDKRMQFTNRSTNTYIRENPYNDPDSWIRLEWQTRNKTAHELALSVSPTGEYNDPKRILKKIFELYAFADGTVDNHNVTRPVVDFWNELFDWKDVESRIIQNAKFVELKTPDQQVIDSFESVMMRTCIFYLTLLGREEFVKRCNAYLRNLEKPDSVSWRRNVAFLNRLNQLSCVDKLPDSITQSSGGLYKLSGRLYFSL